MTDQIPRPDPVPDPVLGPSPALVRRFWRIVALLAVFAAVVAAIAVVLVARGADDGGKGAHIHMLVATALGAWFTIMVGGVLMTLVFISASSGHDSVAQRKSGEGPDQP